MQDEEEDYVYTDNDDDCPDESESHFNIPDAGYNILEYDEVNRIMDSYLTEMSELFRVSMDAAQALLQQYKWYSTVRSHSHDPQLTIWNRNKERLVDVFYSDPEGTLAAAHTSRRLGAPPDVPTMECQICSTVAPPSEFFGLGCDHFFCRYDEDPSALIVFLLVPPAAPSH